MHGAAVGTTHQACLNDGFAASRRPVSPEDKKSSDYSRQIISSFEKALLRFFLTLNRGIPSKDGQWKPPNEYIPANTPPNEGSVDKTSDD